MRFLLLFCVLSVSLKAVAFSEISFNVQDWSWLDEKKYRYAGTVIQEGDTRYMFYCANWNRADRDVVTDHIVFRKANFVNGQWIYRKENEMDIFHSSSTLVEPVEKMSVAVWPGERFDANNVAWDYRHVCDPDIVQGQFRYKRPGDASERLYKYAMFYTGINGDNADGKKHQNQLGWALAEKLDGPWFKVVQGPLIKANEEGWGVGQPSATSVDGMGKVILFYTRGTQTYTGVYRKIMDLSDAANPRVVSPPANTNLVYDEVEIPLTGLTRFDAQNQRVQDFLNNNAAFVYDRNYDRFYIVRNGNMNLSDGLCPSYVSRYVQVAYIPGFKIWDARTVNLSSSTGAKIEGAWTVVADIGQQNGLPSRFFDAGWVKNPFGQVIESRKIEGLISTSLAGGQCEQTHDWLYTYRIHDFSIDVSDF